MNEWPTIGWINGWNTDEWFDECTEKMLRFDKWFDGWVDDSLVNDLMGEWMMFAIMFG